MARNILITRRNWVVDPAASFIETYGVWNFRANMLDARPQVVAEAPENRDWTGTRFAMDLGLTRRVGLIYLVNLLVSPLALIEISAGNDPTFVTNLYHTLTTGFPPEDAEPFEENAWGEIALTQVYLPDEQAKLGYPRIFIPPAAVDCRYILVEIRDSTAFDPICIGCFGACEVWEAGINFEFGWAVTAMDESDIARVPFGTSEVTERGMRRRLNVGFPSIVEDEDTREMWRQAFTVAITRGKSLPLVAAPLPDVDDITRLERSAVYGLVSNDSQLSNPFIGVWRFPFQIDQEI